MNAALIRQSISQVTIHLSWYRPAAISARLNRGMHLISIEIAIGARIANAVARVISVGWLSEYVQVLYNLLSNSFIKVYLQLSQ